MKRRALGGALHLDEPGAFLHDDVHVGAGVGVLAVVKIEHALAADDADRYRRDEARECFGSDFLHRVGEGDAGAGDGGGAGAAIGLDDVAVELDGAFTEPAEVHGGAQGTSDQALDLDRAPALLAAHGLAVGAGVGGAGEHAVLGGDPAATGASQEARHLLLDAGGADHAGVAELDQYRTGGVAGESAGVRTGRSWSTARPLGRWAAVTRAPLGLAGARIYGGGAGAARLRAGCLAGRK